MFKYFLHNENTDADKPDENKTIYAMLLVLFDEYSRFLLGINGVLKGLSRTTDSEIAMEPILWPTFSATSTVPIKD